MRRKGFTLWELLVVIGIFLFIVVCALTCTGLVGYGIYNHVQQQKADDNALNKTPLNMQTTQHTDNNNETGSRKTPVSSRPFAGNG